MHKLLSLLASLVIATNATAIDLSGTVFEDAGTRYNVDPELLYSLAIVESAVVAGGDIRFVVPSPWTLRADKPYYAKNREEAEKLLKRLLKTRKSVDVGICQINTLWQGHRVAKITDLLDPQTNVDIAAKILSENIDKYPNDAVAAIGAYHSTNPSRAFRYAKLVLRVYTNLKRGKSFDTGIR